MFCVHVAGGSSGLAGGVSATCGQGNKHRNSGRAELAGSVPPRYLTLDV